MSGSKKPCTRCHLDDMMKNTGAELEKYISSMSDEIKVKDDEYKKRLSFCESCEHLLNGVCSLCGCFVKARAAKKALSCPNTPPKWLNAE